MICQRVATPAGVAIVCGPRPKRRRCGCGRDAILLCDWKVECDPVRTCDAPICTACATSPAPNKDLCRAHAAEYRIWLSGRPNAMPRPAEEKPA